MIIIYDRIMLIVQAGGLLLNFLTKWQADQMIWHHLNLQQQSMANSNIFSVVIVEKSVVS